LFEDLTYDDTDYPSIGLVPPGTSWDDVLDHIKIAKDFLLIQPEGADGWAGAYWADTEMLVVKNLGPSQDEALDQFREELRERGEL
jgi:hypothetical protein